MQKRILPLRLACSLSEIQLLRNKPRIAAPLNTLADGEDN